VSYQNQDKYKHTFKLTSSHPKEMIIKTPILDIAPFEKGKFAVKFVPFAKESEWKFVLFIKWDGKDFENILLKVNFSSQIEKHDVT